MSILNNTKLKDLYNKVNSIPIEYNLNKYHKVLDKIDKYDFAKTGFVSLKKRGLEIKGQISAGKKTVDLSSELFAIIREVSSREINIRHYDVQMIAAIALAQNRLIQMNTGEGKTMAAVLPAILKAFDGKGVHIFTANDYLASRDAGWMKPVYDFFDLKVGYINEGMSNEDRRSAYDSDVTYLTAREAGFDFLRDQMVLSEANKVQREFYFCLVDEADFILIDEARVPLVIAGNNEEKELDFTGVPELLEGFKENIDYKVDKESRNVIINEDGIDKIEKKFQISNLFSVDNQKLLTAINLALHARALLYKDRDYIIKDGKVEIIDQFTGRIADKRRWPHGIHKAVELKEDLLINKEGTVFNSITIQHFAKLYPNLSGMTATAIQAASEFLSFYNFKITIIPPNKKNKRIDKTDRIYSTKEVKEKALLEKILEINKDGQPVLIGTGSVQESEMLSVQLKERGIKHSVLNAKNHEQEAKVIAEAGKPYRITISTNMAGRGVDIHLGAGSKEEYKFVVDRGGLYIIGTNRHESRRIDNQLRGRAGRQGDPGVSEFFISMEDDLIKRYRIENIIPDRLWPKGKLEPIVDPFITKEINRAQRIIEADNFDIRKTLWDYSNITELQRKVFEELRLDILRNEINSFDISVLDPEKYKQLQKHNSEEKIREIEKYIILYYIDQTWSEFLEKIIAIKEGIHLMRYGGILPVEQFSNQVHSEFKSLFDLIKESIKRSYNNLEPSLDDFDPDKEGLSRPSSTWTYLINDNPFSNFGMDLILNRNVAITSYGGVILIFLLPFLVLIRVISGFLKKMKKE